MSAFMVGKPHIDAMVRLASSGPSQYHGGPGNSGRGLHWYEDRPDGSYLARDIAGDEDRVGAMLWATNLASIEARYPDTVDGGEYPGPIDLTREDVLTYSYPMLGGGRAPTAVEGLSILACYEYQSCEHAGWRTSEARTFCDALRDKLIRCLPGYSDAPWEWRGTPVA